MKEKRGFEMFNKRENSRQYSVVNLFKIPESKRSQLAIFIILAVLILIVLILLFLRGGDIRTLFLGKSPVEKIQDCVKEPLEKGIEMVSKQGGAIEPENYFLYEDNKVDYICYTEESFQKCVMQKPLLKNDIEEDLKVYIEPKVKGCVDSVVSSLSRKGEVSSSEPNISVELVPGSAVVDVEINLKIISGDGTQTYKNIKTTKSSSLYKFVMITSSIANLEAEYGDSEILSYMLNNKWLKVEKIKQGDDTRIYILTNRESNEQFMFAMKSIPIPPGWVEVNRE